MESVGVWKRAEAWEKGKEREEDGRRKQTDRI